VIGIAVYLRWAAQLAAAPEGAAAEVVAGKVAAGAASGVSSAPASVASSSDRSGASGASGASGSSGESAVPTSGIEDSRGANPRTQRLALALSAAGCVALSLLPEGLVALLGGITLP